MQLVLSRRLARDGRGDPHDPQSERRAERRAEHPVEQAHARNDQAAAQPEPETLQAARQDRAAEQRAEQAEGGSVRRGGALRKQQRTEAGPEECADQEPAEGEGSHDEALPEPEKGEDRRERDD